MSLIHHYTTIDNLALILKHKTLRFTRLNLLDDKLEGADFGPYNPLKYMFASCWTQDDQENIPLWKMYASMDSGVRISLEEDLNLFNSYSVTFKSLMPSLYTKDPDLNANLEKVSGSDNPFFNEARMFSPLRPEQIGTEDYGTFPNVDIKKVVVRYSDDYFQKYKDGITVVNGRYCYNPSDFGSYKSKYWEFQKETRFVILTYPACGPERDLIQRNYNNADLKTTYIDVDLNENVFSGAVVRYSPNASESKRLIIESLVRDYPGMRVEESALRDVLRG